MHSVALSLEGALPDMLIDDIGRHNAVDKVIGYGLLHGLDFSRSILLSTGRTSSEILHKAKRAEIPIVLSRGAPTHQTILLSRDMGVTVAGFKRSGDIVVYSNGQRVLTDSGSPKKDCDDQHMVYLQNGGLHRTRDCFGIGGHTS